MLKHSARTRIMAGDASHWLRVTRVNRFVADWMCELNVPFVALCTHLVRLVLQHCELIGPVDYVTVSTGVPCGMFVEHLFAPLERILMARSAHLPLRSWKQSLPVSSVRRMTLPAWVTHTISLDMGVIFVKRRHHVFMTTDTTCNLIRPLMADPAISSCKWGMADRADQ